MAGMGTINGGVTAELVLVTPDMAREWLAKNIKNRPVRRRVVAAYARDMQNGAWQVTGDPIRFDKDGNLLDGQHRLYAVVLSDQPILMLVVGGLEKSTQDVFDSGVRRTPGDVLALRGVKHSTTVASASVLGLALDRAMPTGRSGMFTHTEIIDYVDANPGLLEYAGMGKQYSKHIDLPPSAAAYAVWKTHEANKEAAKVFWGSLVNSETGGEGDARAALLRRLRTAARQNEAWPRMAYVSIVTRTWNAWRQDKTVRAINFHYQGKVIYTVPKLMK